jgi:hypothetical protein
MHSTPIAKDHTVSFSPASNDSHAPSYPAGAPCRSHTPTVQTSPVPLDQLLGVICFPLIPPSHKGATQDLEDKSTFSTRLTRLSYHSNRAEKYPTPHKQSVKPQSSSVTLHSPFIHFFLIFPFLYRNLIPTYFP